MVYKVIWSPLAIQSYISNIEYLEKEWTRKEVTNFIAATQRKIKLLSLYPKIGRLTIKRMHLRQTMIHKRVVLIYRFRAAKREIELIRFFNTYQHPGRIRHK